MEGREGEALFQTGTWCRLFEEICDASDLFHHGVAWHESRKNDRPYRNECRAAIGLTGASWTRPLRGPHAAGACRRKYCYCVVCSPSVCGFSLDLRFACFSGPVLFTFPEMCSRAVPIPWFGAAPWLQAEWQCSGLITTFVICPS
jgi:hypothetical protein